MWTPNPYRPPAPPDLVSPTDPMPRATAATADTQDSGILQTMRRQWISVRTMNRPLRVVAAVSFVQLGVVGVLLGTHEVPQAQVPAGISDNLATAHVPLAAFVAITLSLSLGWCFVLTG